MKRPMLDEPVRAAVPDRSFLSLSGLEQLRAYMRGFLLPLPFTVLWDLQTVHHVPAGTDLAGLARQLSELDGRVATGRHHP